MAKEVFNRHEAKYILTNQQFDSFHSDIKQFLSLDDYNKHNQRYTIHSLYLDTKDNHFIRTSLSKPNYKEKLRIRSYTLFEDDAFVYLEIKKKYRNFVNKRRTKLTYKEALQFIKLGSIEIQPYMNLQVLKEVNHILKKDPLYPTTHIQYDRLAYFSKDDKDIRITFDTNIKAIRNNHTSYLLEKDKYLMEIKVGKTFPLWLNKLLSKHKIYKQSFSKYGTEYTHALETKDISYCNNTYTHEGELQHVRHAFELK